MVRELDAGPERKYAIRLVAVTWVGGNADIVSGVNYTRDGRFRYYRFILPGYRFEIQVGNEALMQGAANSLNLKEDGALLTFNHELSETSDFTAIQRQIHSLKTPKWAQCS